VTCRGRWKARFPALISSLACPLLLASMLPGYCFSQMSAYSGSEHLTESVHSNESQQRLLSDLSRARQLLETHPSAQANLELGQLLSALGEEQSASRFIDRALALNPQLAGAWFEKGLILSDQGDWTKAAADFGRAIALSPDCAAAHLARGEMLLRTGQFDDAASEMRTALRRDAKNSGAHQGLGLIDLQQGNPQLAVEEFKKVLSLRPGSVDAQKGLARAFAYQHKWSEAAGILREVVAANADSSEAASALGNALSNMGDQAGAEAQFARARELSNNELNLLRAQGDRNWGVALRNEAKLSEAAAAFRRAMTDDTGYCEPHNDLGEVLWMEKDWSKALSEFQAAVACRPNSASALNNLGAALLYYKHDLENAMKELRAAIATKPGFAMAHLNLGRALAAKRDFASAESELRSAIAINPDLASAHVNLGLVLAETNGGMSREAKAEMQKGLKLDPQLRQIIPQQYFAQLQETD
jgi:tetratricopeptide (TPR) repeat protein